jgi:hypothetical protein
VAAVLSKGESRGAAELTSSLAGPCVVVCEIAVPVADTVPSRRRIGRRPVWLTYFREERFRNLYG